MQRNRNTFLSTGRARPSRSTVDRTRPPDDPRPPWQKCKGCPLPAVCKSQQQCGFADDGEPS